KQPVSRHRFGTPPAITDFRPEVAFDVPHYALGAPRFYVVLAISRTRPLLCCFDSSTDPANEDVEHFVLCLRAPDRLRRRQRALPWSENGLRRKRGSRVHEGSSRLRPAHARHSRSR